MAFAPLLFLGLGAAGATVASKVLAPKPQAPATLLGNQTASTTNPQPSAPPPPPSAAQTQADAATQADQAAAAMRKRASAGSIGRAAVAKGTVTPKATGQPASLIGSSQPTSVLGS